MVADKVRFDVDGVICISLVEREDRRTLLRESFAALDHEIEFLLVERDSDNPERGCFDSHIRCAQIARERGYRRVLILEDDATFAPPTANHLRRINRFLRWRNPRIFYLGGMLGRSWLIPWRGVVRCRWKGGHCYILSAAACRDLSRRVYAGKTLDGFYCEYFRGYGAFPMLSQQQPETVGRSDLMDHRNQRKGHIRIKDEHYWADNLRRQRAALRRNWARTLLLRYL
ncbi:hypothetical protein [Salinicola avicenniae]|uniref:hypothetical protein n=1 Tax=Salinicola avicenniae TaxID=2916836 RepID=UPI0020748240|nr:MULTISPECIES: hypothetical protein [unclassified Salinicola]